MSECARPAPANKAKDKFERAQEDARKHERALPMRRLRQPSGKRRDTFVGNTLKRNVCILSCWSGWQSQWEQARKFLCEIFLGCHTSYKAQCSVGKLLGTSLFAIGFQSAVLFRCHTPWLRARQISAMKLPCPGWFTQFFGMTSLSKTSGPCE